MVEALILQDTDLFDTQFQFRREPRYSICMQLTKWYYILF